MFDPIDNVSRVTLSNVTNPKHFTESVKEVASSADKVDVPSPDSALSSLRAQISTLESELPGMINQSLHAATRESSGDPLSAIVFRLTDPLSFILKGDSFTREQLNGFQQEVSKFRDEITGMGDSAVSSAKSADLVNKLVSRLTRHLDGVASQIQNKILSV